MIIEAFFQHNDTLHLTAVHLFLPFSQTAVSSQHCLKRHLFSSLIITHSYSFITFSSFSIKARVYSLTTFTSPLYRCFWHSFLGCIATGFIVDTVPFISLECLIIMITHRVCRFWGICFVHLDREVISKAL